MTTTMRVSESTRDRFARLAESTGRPMRQLLDDAVDALERRLYFDRLVSRFDELRDDADAWQEIEEERAVESRALRDESR